MSLITTLGALVNATPILDELAKIRRPAAARYHLGRLIKQVREEVAHFAEERESLIRELGEERDPTEQELKAGQQGKLTAVKPANIMEFIARLNEVAKIEVELDDKYLLTSEMLKDDLLSVDEEAALGSLLIPTKEI
jgi:hypothetical protein